jgi:hypothetical protein
MRPVLPFSLDELEAICDEASPGPWSWVTYPTPRGIDALEVLRHQVDFTESRIDTMHGVLTGQPGHPDALTVANVGCGVTSPQNAKFIACAKEIIPMLIQHIRELESERTRD